MRCLCLFPAAPVFIASLLCCTVASHAQVHVRGRVIAKPAVTYTESVVYSFPASEGAPEASLIQGIDGNLWGTASQGGANGLGEIYRITPAGVFTDMHDFVGADGENPTASLVLGANGLMYGTADSALFSISTSGAFNLLYQFRGAVGAGALVQDSSGILYGTLVSGGAQSEGEIFKYDPFDGVMTDAWDCSLADCETPRGGLMQASDGNGYGAANLSETLYEFSNSTGVSVVYTFNATAGQTANGWSPVGGLSQNSTGLWGFTLLGGANDDGVIFEVTPSENGLAYTKKFDLGPTVGEDSSGGALTLGGDGNLYGAAAEGGTSGYGTVYQIDPSADTITAIYNFSATDAQNPDSPPIEAADGTLWGTTVAGGASGGGAIYKLTPSTPIPPAITLTASPAVVALGSNSTLSYTLTNAYSDTAKLCNYFVNGSPFGAAPSTPGTVTFAPTQPGTTSIAYSCGGVETATATISTPGEIVMTSVTHNFGNLSAGQSVVYGVEITNTMATPLTNTGIHLDPQAGLTEQTHCPPTLAAGASCETVFTFAPTALGTVSAHWYLDGTPQGTTFTPDNGGYLTGTGVVANAVTLSTNGHNFGTVSVGSTSAIYGTLLTNGTSSPITLAFSGVTAPFIVSASNCPQTLAGGASCDLQFEFAPHATGTSQQLFAITATQNGSRLPITASGVLSQGVTLTGTGK